MTPDGAEPARPRRRASLAGAAVLAGAGLGVLSALGSAHTPAPTPRRVRDDGTRRAGAATERWRPRLRFTPARDGLNAGHDVVRFDGEYHLFFQHDPDDVGHARLSWGHAVSSDLVRWTPLPVALRPDELGEVLSGSAVVDEHDVSGFFAGGSGLLAYYTSAGATRQQCLAYSGDHGRTWTKYAANPIIPNPGNEDFRDPKVFRHEPSGRWVLLAAAGDRIVFYGSTDLVRWTWLSEFGVGHGAHDGAWECPDLFELPVDGDPHDTRWVLVVSTRAGSPAGGSGTQYFLGDFDGTTFTNHAAPSVARWLDRGPDHGAARTWSQASNGRRVLLGWLNNAAYAAHVPTAPWRGATSTPREVGLAERDGLLGLTQRPVTELTSTRRTRSRWRETVRGTTEVPGASGATLDVLASFDVSGTDAGPRGEFGLDVFVGAETRTRIGYDTRNRELFVDRRCSGDARVGPDFPRRYGTPLSLPDAMLRLRVVLDRSSVEVFTADGHVVLTALVLPDVLDNAGVEVFATGMPADADVTVFALEPER